MISQAKNILEKHNLSETHAEFVALKNHLSPHFNWIGYYTKIMIEDKVSLYNIFKLHDVLQAKKVNLKEVSKLKYSQLGAFLKRYDATKDPSYEYVFSAAGYDIYQVFERKGIEKIGSPLWCIQSQKYWDQYIGDNGTQYVAIETEYADTLLDSQYKNILQAQSGYKVKNPNIRFGITLKFGCCMIFDENNHNVQNWGAVVVPTKILGYDLHYRQKKKLDTFIIHDQKNEYANADNCEKIETDDFVATLFQRERDTDSSLPEYYYIIKSKKLDVGQNLNILYLLINRKTINKSFPNCVTEMWNDLRNNINSKTQTAIYESDVFKEIIARIGLHWDKFHRENYNEINPNKRRGLWSLFPKK